MPSIFAFEAHAYAGALATYGIDRRDTILQTADYVDRILRGPSLQTCRFKQHKNSSW